MTLYLIGLGLCSEKDITVKGLEIIKKCDIIYLENYTSVLQRSVKTLEKFYGKKIIPADRELIEKRPEETILNNAKNKEVALLIIGDPMCATTHIDLLLRAKKLEIKTRVIHNASIVSAVGITGLEVYKFGKIASIPFKNENIKTPYTVLQKNLKNDMHTLFLLDLDPAKNRFLTIKEAIEYLIKQGMPDNRLCVGCARLGSEDFLIKAGKAADLKNIDFGNPPYCLIVPAKLHFIEEEAIAQWEYLSKE